MVEKNYNSQEDYSKNNYSVYIPTKKDKEIAIKKAIREIETEDLGYVGFKQREKIHKNKKIYSRKEKHKKNLENFI